MPLRVSTRKFSLLWEIDPCSDRAPVIEIPRVVPTSAGQPTCFRECAGSTAVQEWSGKRDSNPRPSAWKADALATELFPHMDLHLDDDGGGGRIRTFEGVSRQIYSLLPLAARAPLHADSRAQGAARDAAALVLAGGARTSA